MLNAVSDSYDKREGSFIFDALAPAAEQIISIDNEIEEAKRKFVTVNLEGDELTIRVEDITGIKRRPAIFATGSVTVTGTGTINLGDLFETEGGVQFKAKDTKNISIEGVVEIEALIAGSSGNVAADTITLFPITLPGFTKVNNTHPTVGGFNAESDSDLTQRYYERLRTPATSGNKSHYLNWAKEVPGVGEAKILPLWNGNNTVKILIIDSNRLPASTEIIDSVQNYIDPSSQGLGEGTAPIGAYCTVVSATGVNIDIAVTVTLQEGHGLQDVTSDIEVRLIEYLREIAFLESFVSYARVGNAIINVEGVSDYINLSINNGTSNINIGIEEVAVLGMVVVDE